MDFLEMLQEISEKIKDWKNGIPKVENQSEEQTKMCLIIPFIRALGYDPNSAKDIIAEFTADLAGKKGEKVDYAIMSSTGEPLVLVEAKSFPTNFENGSLLSKHRGQIARYFGTKVVNQAKFAILTNGNSYKFYTDLERVNQLDDRPFLEFKMEDFLSLSSDSNIVKELKKFKKGQFSTESIRKNAESLKDVFLIKNLIKTELDNPSDDFIRYFGKQVYKKKFNKNAEAKMKPKIIDAIAQYKRGLEVSYFELIQRQATANQSEEHEKVAEVVTEKMSKVVTTQDEKDGHNIIRAILREKFDVNRIVLVDYVNLCTIGLDSSRQPVCKFYFDSEPMQIRLYDGESESELIEITSVDDLYQFADRIVDGAMGYEKAVSGKVA